MYGNDVTGRVDDGQSGFQQFAAQITNVLLMSGTQLTTFATPQNLHDIYTTSLAATVHPFIKCNIGKSDTAEQRNDAESRTIYQSITFRVSRRRREMYCGHARLCVCVPVRGRTPTLLHGPGCNLGSGRGCSLVVHCWADLQSVHGFGGYDNITRTRNVSEYMLVLALYLVVSSTHTI